MIRVITVLLLAFALPLAAAEWPQWRGPDGQGHAPDASDLPTTWRVGPAGQEVTGGENIRWRTELPGRAWSSPVIDGDSIWLTTAIEQGSAEEGPPPPGGRKPQPRSVAEAVTFRAIGIDRRTGNVLHDVELFTVEHPQPTHVLNSFASPSPVLAEGKLFCQFGDYGTACLDTSTAAVVWHNRSQRLNHENGPGGSPIIWKNLLIFHCDGSDVQYIVALDAATGKQAWRTDRSGEMRDNPELKKAYGTPLVTTINGRDVLLSPAADWLYGYDPATGKELWKLSYGVLGFSIVPRPVVADGIAYIGTSFMKAELLAVRLGPTAALQPEILWRYGRSVPNMPSPLLVGDAVYLFSDKGIATCLDAATGEVRWTGRLGGSFSSSPLLADGKIYVGSRDGEMFVIRPGEDLDIVATNNFGEAIMASPAAVGRAVYVRTERALYRIEQ
jgi:outer membrane protein assembly factor BamB